MSSSPESPSDPLIGHTFSQYEIVAKLGGGGMGVVYKARDTRLGRHVALKFLPSQWSHDDAAKQRFMREAQAASATNHRNICVVHNIEESADGRLFIVMAYYEGQTLKRRLESGPLPVADVIEIAMEIAEGLAKAHAQGVIHRDVKPGNLMITDDGVKILDFGLAKFADALQLTAPGSTIGTYAYMAPEQARGEEADERSDVWALGIVMYEMLAGAAPFRGAYPEATFHAIKHEPLPSLRVARPDVPEPLERIVMKALEKDVGQRYQSAREAARDLRLLAGRSVPLELLTEALPELAARRAVAMAAGSPRPRSWRLPAVAGAVALALALLGTYLWQTRAVERTLVAIAPVANHTGVVGLDRYRLALTASLLEELRESPNIRVVPYPRLLEMIRPFVPASADLSGSESVHAVASGSGAPFVVVPTLTYRDRDASWLMQVQIRNADTGTTVSSYETAAVNSALSEQTAFRLVTAAANEVQAHFKAHGVGRSYRERPASIRFQQPEAARQFADGVDAYDQLEYQRASEAFTAAAQIEPQHALTHAWASRVFWLLSRKSDAVGSAQRARQLVTSETSAIDRAFIEAVVAESQGDMDAADRAYAALAAVRDDDGWARIERADFLKRRQDRNQAAIELYHDVLKRDPSYVRPHVDLCQLYTRIDDHPLAEREAQTALERFRASGGKNGEAQALLCLAEEQRKQAGTHLVDARKSVETARQLLVSLDASYNLARAQFYAASVEYSADRLTDAQASFRTAADSLGAVGNRALQGVALMNLGAISFQLGHPTPALEFFQRGHQVFYEIGDERRAAEADINVAGVQNDHGVDPTGTSRLVSNARTTLERLGYVEFQLLALQSEAESHRYAGRIERARTLLRSAYEIARTRGLTDNMNNLAFALAQADLQANDYREARAALERIVAAGSSSALEARIALGTVLTRLGDFDRADALLRQSAVELENQQRPGLRPLAHGAQAQLALQRGDPVEASRELDEAITSWTDPLPNAAAVEARCDRGLEEALRGRLGPARADFDAGLVQSGRVGRLTVEARCRVGLARLYLVEGRADEASKALSAIPEDSADTEVGPELRAQIEFWRGQALKTLHPLDVAPHWQKARQLLDAIQGPLSEEERNRYAARLEIRTILQGTAFR